MLLVVVLPEQGGQIGGPLPAGQGIDQHGRGILHCGGPALGPPYLGREVQEPVQLRRQVGALGANGIRKKHLANVQFYLEQGYELFLGSVRRSGGLLSGAAQGLTKGPQLLPRSRAKLLLFLSGVCGLARLLRQGLSSAVFFRSASTAVRMPTVDLVT